MTNSSMQNASRREPGYETDPAATSGEGLGALLAFAGPRRWLVALGCVLSGISAVLALVPYFSIWHIVNAVLCASSGADIATGAQQWVLVAAGCAVASVVTYMAGLGCTHRAAFHLAAAIRVACCDHLLHVPMGYYQTTSSGDLRRHIDTGADMTEDVVAHKLPDVVAAAVTPIAIALLCFAFDWRMGLACLVPIVLGMASLSATMGKQAASSMDDYQDALDAMNRQAVEYVRGIPVVKVFQQTARSFREFRHTIVAYGNLAFGFAQAGERPQVTFATITASTFVLLIPVAAFAASTVDAGSWPRFVADFVFYALVCGITPGMLTRIMYIGQSTMSARTAARNVQAILGIEPLPQPDFPQTMEDASVEFDDVSFAYDGSARNAVSHVSFRAEEGQTIALVGPSGSGKSTCAALVPRFWDACEGAVRVGGHDVRDLDPRDLMENVAFVFQNGRLMRGTVLENVAAARPRATRDEVLRALEEAQCADIIAKLPQGVDTPIGEGGAYLSGGERQRLLIARAILKDAAIVVLDEATAFADADNEARIHDALGRAMEGRTVILVAHRLSTVVDADQIVVLDEGSVAERGTHGSLLERGGLYARMWEDYRRSTEWQVKSERTGAAPAANEEAGGPHE
ncbi:MAG: ABC transporter ATP-binding protein [Coriobacteriaceae bacterium]|nr:ABC transporter ATP-binding protein [Coriobacteriaceae bacterium]